MAKKKSAKKSSGVSRTDISVGVGITTAAAALAGAYFLYGSKHAKQNRKMVKSWILKAKAEALETLEKAEKMSKSEYEAMIDQIAKSYASVQDATKSDIADFKREMKAHWNQIEKTASHAGGATRKAAKKAAKKVVKKATKRARKVVKTAKKKK